IGENTKDDEAEPAAWGPLDQHTVQRVRVGSFISTQRTIQRLKMSRQAQIDDPQNDDVPDEDSSPVQPDDQDKPRKRDYIHVPSHPHLMKLLNKQGDQIVLFADKVLKFTGSGKMKNRILLITDFAVYIADPESSSLKRRIALAAVEKICLSELTDNFLAIIIPTEYDLLIASARKNEIITAFYEAYELEVVSSNRFEYNAASDMVKEIEFEEVEGGVKTRILRK
ncbi:Myosin ID heavy chain, partial [Mucuna pruriens]